MFCAAKNFPAPQGAGSSNPAEGRGDSEGWVALLLLCFCFSITADYRCSLLTRSAKDSKSRATRALMSPRRMAGFMGDFMPPAVPTPLRTRLFKNHPSGVYGREAKGGIPLCRQCVGCPTRHAFFPLFLRRICARFSRGVSLLLQLVFSQLFLRFFLATAFEMLYPSRGYARTCASAREKTDVCLSAYYQIVKLHQ